MLNSACSVRHLVGMLLGGKSDWMKVSDKSEEWYGVTEQAQRVHRAHPSGCSLADIPALHLTSHIRLVFLPQHLTALRRSWLVFRLLKLLNLLSPHLCSAWLVLGYSDTSQTQGLQWSRPLIFSLSPRTLSGLPKPSRSAPCPYRISPNNATVRSIWPWPTLNFNLPQVSTTHRNTHANEWFRSHKDHRLVS